MRIKIPLLMEHHLIGFASSDSRCPHMLDLHCTALTLRGILLWKPCRREGWPQPSFACAFLKGCWRSKWDPLSNTSTPILGMKNFGLAFDIHKKWCLRYTQRERLAISDNKPKNHPKACVSGTWDAQESNQDCWASSTVFREGEFS